MRSPEMRRLGDSIAAATHDLNNVLAIVRESGGLVRDLHESGAIGRPERAETLRRAFEAIDRQVDRGEIINRHLNRLAHLMDRPQEGIDADDLAELVVFLVSRASRTRRVTLETARKGRVRISCPEPGRLALVLAVCAERIISRLEPGATLVVRPERRWGRMSVRFVAGGDTPVSLSAEGLLTDLSASVSDLELEIRDGDGEAEIIVAL